LPAKSSAAPANRKALGALLPHAAGGAPMHVNIILIQPLLALLVGILILILPRLLNYLIALYLIFIGLIGLFPQFFTSLGV